MTKPALLRSSSIVFATAAALVGCGGGEKIYSGPPPPQPKGVLSISPSSLQFLLGNATPVAVTVTSSHGFGTPNAGNPQAVMVRISDPADFGAQVVAPQPGATSATINVIPIGGAAPATFTVDDLMNDEGTFTGSSEPCGQPDEMTGAQLLYPPSGTKGVATNTPTIYVSTSVLAGIAPPPIKLHFVLNSATTQEGGVLASATPPPGATATPAPLSGSVNYTFAEAMPQLATNNVYDVYAYDNACETPFKAGTFST